MGAVYRAEDTELQRQVALKVLPEAFAHDPERLARFRQEARSLAALNHPNIVSIYSVEEADGTRFLTMELVEGDSLAQLVARGGLDLEQFFDISIPLSEALAAAHEEGVVHRDLKPANVMVTRRGEVKVLDFGLAKRLQTEPAQGGEGQALPTVTQLTQEGLIVGTVAYMSPEQAEGKEVDPRSDIFSLGVLLYEMATGTRPFGGDSNVSMLASILKDRPSPVTESREELPIHLGRIIRRCLEKDPERRYQSAKDVRNELEGLRRELMSVGEGAPQAAPASARRRVGRVGGAVAAALLTVAGVAYWAAKGESPPPKPPAVEEPT